MVVNNKTLRIQPETDIYSWDISSRCAPIKKFAASYFLYKLGNHRQNSLKIVWFEKCSAATLLNQDGLTEF